MNKRKQLILKMRAKRMPYRQIGQLLGISWQRAHQIATGYASPFNMPKPGIDHKTLFVKKRDRLDIPKVLSKGLKGRDFIRERVRARDNYICQLCLKQWEPGQRRFDVHHMDERQEGKGNNNYTIDKNNMDKMITLCHKCHLNLDIVKTKISGGTKRAVDKLAA